LLFAKLHIFEDFYAISGLKLHIFSIFCAILIAELHILTPKVCNSHIEKFQTIKAQT